MTRKTRKSPAGTEGGRRPTGVPAGRAAGEHLRRDQGRWNSRRKTEIVLRLLKGEPLDAVSREESVSASRLAQWRDEAITGMQAALMSREPDHRDGLIHDLKAKVGDQAMTLELLERKIDLLEDGLRPPARRPML